MTVRTAVHLNYDTLCCGYFTSL